MKNILPERGGNHKCSLCQTISKINPGELPRQSLLEKATNAYKQGFLTGQQNSPRVFSSAFRITADFFAAAVGVHTAAAIAEVNGNAANDIIGNDSDTINDDDNNPVAIINDTASRRGNFIGSTQAARNMIGLSHGLAYGASATGRHLLEY